MSNIIKPVYFNVDRANKKIIETDAAIREKFESQKKDEYPEDFTFVPGINVINIEEIIEEQKNNVMDGASEMLSKAKAEADGIIEAAKQTAESVKQEAYNEGFNRGVNDGREKAADEIESMKQELNDRETLLQAEYEQVISEIEPQFAEIVGNLVEKITGVLIENTDVFHYLIDRAIKEIPVSGKYIIHVSSDDFAEVNSSKNILDTMVPPGAIVDVMEDVSLEKNKCIVETETHMIDSSIDVQLSNLKRELRLLSIS